MVKTTSVQFLGEKTERKLKVNYMNQQSDSADLLGGFKPVSLSRSLHSLRELLTSCLLQHFLLSGQQQVPGSPGNLLQGHALVRRHTAYVKLTQGGAGQGHQD